MQWFIAKNGEIVSHRPDTDVWTAFGVNDQIIDSPTGLKVAGNDYVYVFGSHQSKAAISYYDGIKWGRYVFPGLGLLVAYNGCAETPDGKMWFGAGGNYNWSPGTKGGLMSFDPIQKKWCHHDLGEENYRNTSMAGAPDGLLWIGCPNIARTYNGQRISFMPIGPSPSAWTDDLIATPQNKVWIAKSGIGTFQVSGQSWTEYTTAEGMISNSPTSLYYSNQGMLWVGTENGICCFDGKNWISNTFISQFKMPRESGTIRESRDGALWINLSERDWYFRAQFLNQNLNNVNKDYIFKTIRCQFDTVYPPVTEFTEIETRIAHGGKAFFSWRAKDSWDVTPKEQMQFSYKLDDKAWSPFTYETNVIFDSLKNGRHVLQVRARDGDLNIDPSLPQVKFLVEKAYWQQTWFILALIVIVLGFGYFEFRIIQARRKLAVSNLSLKEKGKQLERMNDDLQLSNQELEQCNRELKQSNFELEQARELLTKANLNLQRSNQELELFAYVASHDLQEPLRMISSYMGLVTKRYGDKLNTHGNEFIGYAVDGANRMQQLIIDLLNYSRVTTQGRPFEPTDMEKVFAGALKNLEVAVSECGGKVTHDVLPVVQGDAVQLERLLQNLVGNAVKYRGERKPEVHVSATEREGSWVFSVADNGIGIDAQHHDRIFGIFQRLHTREQYSGTGIGLAVCKKIVERHGGRIWLASEEGKGSTFYFSLPAGGGSS